jgi:ribosomal protein S25
MPSNQLSLAEELLLITLDDSSGKLFPSAKPFAIDIAIAASLIMELTLNGRIDTDSEKLFVISTTPTGNQILDDILDEINAEKTSITTSAWVTRIGQKGESLNQLIIKGLVDRGILMSVEKRLLWVFKTRVYPPASGIEEREVRARVMHLIVSDEIPNPRDSLIVGLLRATSLINHLFTPDVLETLQVRIDNIVNLEEINRSLNTTVQEAWQKIIDSTPVIRIW